MNVELGNPDTARARARWWGDAGDIVQLVLTDQHTVPTDDELRTWVEATARSGAATLRTGALFPDAADRFAAAGFEVIDRLSLLQIDLEHDLPAGAPGDGDGHTGALRRRHDASAAAIDRRAFGPPWANDVDDLGEIRRATPVHRARARFLTGPGWRRPVVAFAITGAAQGQGYLQRLAVDPDHQRGGHGRALTLDALGWMRRRRLRRGFVNTAVTNDAALALYDSVGFRPMRDQLVVMQRALR